MIDPEKEERKLKILLLVTGTLHALFLLVGFYFIERVVEKLNMIIGLLR